MSPCTQRWIISFTSSGCGSSQTWPSPERSQEARAASGPTRCLRQNLQRQKELWEVPVVTKEVPTQNSFPHPDDGFLKQKINNNATRAAGKPPVPISSPGVLCHKPGLEGTWADLCPVAFPAGRGGGGGQDAIARMTQTSHLSTASPRGGRAPPPQGGPGDQVRLRGGADSPGPRRSPIPRDTPRALPPPRGEDLVCTGRPRPAPGPTRPGFRPFLQPQPR